MKKSYCRPRAEKIAFSYQEQIVASQMTGGHYMIDCESGYCEHLTGCRLEKPGVQGMAMYSSLG